MRLAVLGSGSGGNALVVESGGSLLLVDAGFSCRRIEKGLKRLGVAAAELDALLLTHEHGDHVRGADRLVRRHEVPVWATEGTLSALELGDEAAEHVRPIRSGRPVELARRRGGTAFRVEAFHLPHDAREPVGYLVEDDAGHRLGVLSDLGARSQLAWGRLLDLDAVVLETNHDLQLLRSGPYPWHLKQRVAGRHGHLSNEDAARGLEELATERLQAVVLYHLSRTNNLPALAVEAVGSALDRLGSRARVVLTAQDEATPWLELETPSAEVLASTGRNRTLGQLELTF